MYILCTSGIFFFCLDGVVTQLESLGFIVAYIAYIVLVLVSPNPVRSPSTAVPDMGAGLLSDASYESLKDVESLNGGGEIGRGAKDGRLERSDSKRNTTHIHASR